ncbi:MAG TPA: glycosyltransferase family 2 protein [Thermotogota bacterium]|mgnify:CR=1 FL=1|nr:glycosyltransferase family 2 protein [Thermotogota bacterium]HRW93564.1 glycosyltransferase family 2 protein [Thermotogota bacterium]
MKGICTWLCGVILFVVLLVVCRMFPFQLRWQGSLAVLVGGFAAASMVGFVVWFQVYTRRPKLLSAETIPPLLILLTEKNEGKRVLLSALRWLDYSPNIQVRVCDDHSQDDSVSLLEDCQARFPGRFSWFPNDDPHAGKRHPKAFALEQTLRRSPRARYLLILDADSQVSFPTLQRSLFSVEQHNLDVLSLTRRNTKPARPFSWMLADGEELVLSFLKWWGIAAWVFPGSGIILRMDKARELHVPTRLDSEDSWLGAQARQKGWKIGRSLTEHCMEDAPPTLGKLLDQRAKWNRQAILFQLNNHPFQSLVFSAVFALFFAGLFSLGSVWGAAVLAVFGALTGLGWVLHMNLGTQKAPIAAWNALWGSLFLLFFQLPCSAGYFLLFPFLREKPRFSKTT